MKVPKAFGNNVGKTKARINLSFFISSLLSFSLSFFLPFFLFVSYFMYLTLPYLTLPWLSLVQLNLNLAS